MEAMCHCIALHCTALHYHGNNDENNNENSDNAGRNQDCIELCEEAKGLAPAEYCGPLFANIARLQASGLVARDMHQEAQIILLEALQAYERSLDCLLDLAEVSVRKTFYQKDILPVWYEMLYYFHIACLEACQSIRFSAHLDLCKQVELLCNDVVSFK